MKKPGPMTVHAGDSNDMSAKHILLPARECHLVPLFTWLVCCMTAVWTCASGTSLAQTISSQSQSFRLANADAGTVAPQLKKLLSDYGAGAEVLIERSQNRIVVRANESTRQLAAQLIQTLDKESVTKVVPAQAEQRGIVHGYPVDGGDIDKLAEELRKQYPPSMGVRIAPDSRTSQLVVIAPAGVHEQIRAYLSDKAGSGLSRGSVAARQMFAATVPQYQLRNITWHEFEKSLRSLWGASLRIVPDSATRTTSVFMSDDTSGSPVLQINERTNVITFDAASDSGRSWRQIALALDRANSIRGGATQLIPLRHADPAKVREAVAAIRDAALRMAPGDTMAAVPVSQQGRPRDDASNLVSMIFQSTPAPQNPQGAAPAPANPNQNPAQPQQPGAQGQQPDAQGQQPAQPGAEEPVGLLGDVQIEFIPELGVIILKGNKRDVQRVQAIIDEIEEQSKTTRPEIYVAALQHANSESLATLVTQVYDAVYAPRQGSLSITALVMPNAILLVGKQENIDTALELIDKLDQPVAPDTQIKVFRLLHMSALSAETVHSQLLWCHRRTTTTAGATAQQSVRGLSPRVTVIGDYRSNSLIVQASPRDLEEVAELLNSWTSTRRMRRSKCGSSR